MAEDHAICLDGSLRSREAVMAHWPKTVRGKLVTFLLTIAVVSIVVWFALALSGPLAWISLAVVAIAALTSVTLYAWGRRANAARERAWVGEFSFGDVVHRMRAREALDLSHGVAGVL
jgi:predicted membrane chloride channel (bestrophin family)